MPPFFKLTHMDALSGVQSDLQLSTSHARRTTSSAKGDLAAYLFERTLQVPISCAEPSKSISTSTMSRTTYLKKKKCCCPVPALLECVARINFNVGEYLHESNNFIIIRIHFHQFQHDILYLVLVVYAI